MLATKFTKLLNFQLSLLGLLVARRHVVALIAIRAGERDVIPHL